MKPDNWIGWENGFVSDLSTRGGSSLEDGSGRENSYVYTVGMALKYWMDYHSQMKGTSVYAAAEEILRSAEEHLLAGGRRKAKEQSNGADIQRG